MNFEKSKKNSADFKGVAVIKKLPSEDKIIESWPDNEKPLVSICCITYNHRDYIESALCGFLTQVTKFRFEILVHDDASSDGTWNILKKYRDEYPRIIKVIRQKENQYSKNPIISPRFLWPLAAGKYIALCEGDDYWCDEEKLQRQVEILENDKNVSMVHSDVSNLVSLWSPFDRMRSSVKRRSGVSPARGNMRESAWGFQFGIHTCTMLFRAEIATEIIRSGLLNVGLKSGDYLIFLFCSQRGAISFLDRVTAVYRESPGSATNSDFSAPVRFTVGILEASDIICNYFDVSDEVRQHYRTAIRARLKRVFAMQGTYRQLPLVKGHLSQFEYKKMTLIKVVRFEKIYFRIFRLKLILKKLLTYDMVR